MNAPYRPPLTKSESDAAPPAKPEPTPRERIARAKSLARRALAYWKISALLFIVGCGIAVVVAMNVKRIYRSECVVLVKPAMKTDDNEESASVKAVKLAPKLKDTLLTRGRLEPIIKEYGLYGQTVDSKGMVDAIQEMKVHIGFRGRDSETFVISFEGDDAEMTRAITQRLADTMMDDFRKNNLAATKQRADFLASEEQRAEQDVESANKALATFLAEHPEFATDAPNSFVPRASGGGAAPNLPLPPAAGGDAQLGALLRQRTRIESEIRAATTNAGDSAHAPNESIAQLTKQRDEAAKKVAAAQTDLADKRTRYTDQHPDVIAAKAQTEAAASALHVAEQQLDAAKGGLPAPDTSQASPELQKKLADLNQLIAARQAEIARHPPVPAASVSAVEPKAPPEPVNPLVELETEWARLLRATSDAKATHDDLQRRGEKARLYVSAAEATGDTQMEIIDPAFKPTRPARGGRTNAALAGFGIAAIVSLAYAFGRVVTNDTIFDAADVEALNVIPILGIVPRLPPAQTVMPQAVPMPEAPHPPGGARAT